MKTLLLALISPSKSKGTREGAIRGLVGVGKEAVRKGLVESGGAKVVGSECAPSEHGPLVDSALVRLFPFTTFALFIDCRSISLGCVQDIATTVRYARRGAA